jgi:hypothetical protein
VALTWPWVLAAAGVAFVAAVAAGLLWRRGPGGPGKGAPPLAGTERYLALPAVQKAVRRSLAGGVAALAGVALLAAGAALVAARPVSELRIRETVSNRDVVLCLDVSGSMSEVAAEVVEEMATMVDGFDGDRVALSVFNARSVTVFPLTDDYGFLRERLDQVGQLLRPNPWSMSGTDFPLDGLVDPDLEASSLIGDGLAMCADLFDQPGVARSRTIIFATDNENNGVPLVSLEDAAKLATQRGARVFALYPYFFSQPEGDELEKAVQSTGGAMYKLDDAEAAGQVVRQVAEQAATPMERPPTVVKTDHPGFGAALAGAGVAVLAGLGAGRLWGRFRSRRGL